MDRNNPLSWASGAFAEGRQPGSILSWGLAGAFAIFRFQAKIHFPFPFSFPFLCPFDLRPKKSWNLFWPHVVLRGGGGGGGGHECFGYFRDRQFLGGDAAGQSGSETQKRPFCCLCSLKSEVICRNVCTSFLVGGIFSMVSTLPCVVRSAADVSICVAVVSLVQMRFGFPLLWWWLRWFEPSHCLCVSCVICFSWFLFLCESKSGVEIDRHNEKSYIPSLQDVQGKFSSPNSCAHEDRSCLSLIDSE